MHFDTDGVYTLLYTAEDSCGNETVEEREVVVGEPRTVLYADGTLIINEQPKDRANNILLHGNAQNIYAVFDPNGSTDVDKYIFANQSARPWHSQRYNIKSVEFGEDIMPTSTAYWFYQCNQCVSFNSDGLDTQNVTNMATMFFGCANLSSLDVTSFDTSNVTSMVSMFNGCADLTNLDLSNFDTSRVTNMGAMFSHCGSLTSLDLSAFNTANCTQMWSMFEQCESLTSIDLSNFNTARVVSMGDMFSKCTSLTEIDISSFDASNVADSFRMFSFCGLLQTIYTSATLNFQSATDSTDMFAEMSANLVGGAGTTWASSNPKNKAYAHVDGGTSDPGYFTAKSA